MAVQIAGKTYQRITREMLDKTTSLSWYAPVATLTTALRKTPGVVEVKVVGNWQGLGARESDVPEGADALKEDFGLVFMDVYVVTSSDAPLRNCRGCGDLVVEVEKCDCFTETE